MEFFEEDSICVWAEERGLARGAGFEVRLPDWPIVYQGAYASGSRSGHERAAAEGLVRALDPWDECLVWITGWGVYPSGEDWPTFYAWRGAKDERRSLEIAPGHRLDRDEAELLTELLTLIMENAWDAEILGARGASAVVVRGYICHDEWFEVTRPQELTNGAGTDAAAASNQ